MVGGQAIITRRSSFLSMRRIGGSMLKSGQDYGNNYLIGESVASDDLVLAVTCKDNEVEYVSRALEKSEMPVQDMEGIEDNLALLASLDHPHICRFVEAFDNEERIHMVYEKARPVSIFDEEPNLKAGKPLAQEAAQVYIRQLSMALSVAHKQGIVHGRLAPSSLLVDLAENAEDGGRSAKICDMGQTFILRPPRKTLKGCEGPELATGDLAVPGSAMHFKVGLRAYQSADMWSLGIILYLMLTGSLPWAKSQTPLQEAIASDSIEFGKEWRLMPDAKDIVEKLLRGEGRIRLTADKVLRHPWIILSRTKVSKSKMIRVLQNVIFNTTETTFKKFCMRVIAEEMPPEKLAVVTQAFRAIDKNGDGSLEVSEIESALRRYGEEEGQAAEIFEAIDRDASGSLNFAEFTAVSIGPAEYCDKETLWHVFNRFDKDGNGSFDRSEIGTVVREIEHLSESSGLEHQVEEIAIDVSMPVDFDTFVHHMITPAGAHVSTLKVGWDRFCHSVFKVDMHGVRHIAPKMYDHNKAKNRLLISPYSKTEHICVGKQKGK